MSNVDLAQMFDDKFGKIKDSNPKKYQVNLKYAEAYLKLVQDVIANINDEGKTQNINVKNNVLGNYYTEKDDTLSKSRVELDENGLEITLFFEDSDPKRALNRDSEYDEELINQILSENNISVSTFYGDGKNYISSVRVKYSRELSLNNSNQLHL